jgi:hypothetical protein
MRGLALLILVLLAFACGIIAERLWLSASFNEPQVIVQSQPPHALSLPSQISYAEEGSRAPETSNKGGAVEDIVSALQQNLARLELENLKLKQQLEAQNNPLEPDLNLPNTDLNSLLTHQYEQEEVRAPWADEVELQIADFLYQNNFSHLVELRHYGCKQTVCKVEIVPLENAENFDHSTWELIRSKVFKQSWYKYFSVATSSSNDERMVMLLSTRQAKD